MREDVVGRANVDDTAELEAYYQTLDQQGLYALWTVANKIEPWFPKSSSVPTLWRFDEMRPLVLKAIDLVSPEKAGRRGVDFNTIACIRLTRKLISAPFSTSGNPPDLRKWGRGTPLP